jgi:transposase
MDLLELKEIEVSRNGKLMKFQAAEFNKKAPTGPYASELKEYLQRHVQREYPELLKSEVEALFEEEGYSLLFTPPYSPRLQPIELFWAGGKNHVARLYNPGQPRTIEETRKQLREGFYGNAERPPIDCRNLVEHALKECDFYISNPAYRMVGSVGRHIVALPLESKDNLEEEEEFEDANNDMFVDDY